MRVANTVSKIVGHWGLLATNEMQIFRKSGNLTIKKIKKTWGRADTDLLFGMTAADAFLPGSMQL